MMAAPKDDWMMREAFNPIQPDETSRTFDRSTWNTRMIKLAFLRKHNFEKEYKSLKAAAKKIFSNPQMMSNPAMLQELMKDPEVASFYSKLMPKLQGMMGGMGGMPGGGMGGGMPFGGMPGGGMGGNPFPGGFPGR